MARIPELAREIRQIHPDTDQAMRAWQHIAKAWHKKMFLAMRPTFAIFAVYSIGNREAILFTAFHLSIKTANDGTYH